MIGFLALMVALLLGNPDEPVVRCDGVIEQCRNAEAVPWPDADLPALCRAKSVFCRDDYIDARPAEVGGYRTGDTVGNRGEVTDEALWAIVDHFPQHHWRQAVHVMACESNFDPEARNRHSSATGAWQWLRRDWAWYTADVMGEQMHLDLRRNLESATRVTAHRVNREGGFGAWSCRRWTP